MNSKEAIAWYEKHIPEAAIAAHRIMMRGDYGGEPVYFWYKPNGLSIRVARGEDKGPVGHKLVTKEHAPGNLEQAQLVRWLIDRTRRLELFPKEGSTEGLDGVGKGTRKGTRVRFSAHPGSLVLYSRHPEIGEEGTVDTMPGFGKRTYLPGPGGGLLYVDWDQSGMIGVSPNDVEKLKAKQSGLGPAPSGPASGFGKEKTREDYRRRINWEAWAAAKAREDGHEAVAQGHDMARADYLREHAKLSRDRGLSEYEGKMKSLSYGVMPSKAEFVMRTEGHYPYPMELVGADREVVQDLLNDEGIEEFDSKYRHKLGVRVLDAKAMYRFLTRLKDTYESEHEGRDAAGDLASSILGTLGYEWI